MERPLKVFDTVVTGNGSIGKVMKFSGSGGVLVQFSSSNIYFSAKERWYLPRELKLYKNHVEERHFADQS